MENKTLYILPIPITANEGLIKLATYAFILAIIISVLLRLTGRLRGVHESISKMPLINGTKPWSFSANAETQNFLQNASILLEEGFRTSAKAFRIQTDHGIRLVLSAEYADSIKNHPDLSLPIDTGYDFHGNIPGFNLWAIVGSENRLIVKTIKEHLLNRSPTLYQPLSSKTSDALSLTWSDNTEWHELCAFPTAYQIIGRPSSFIFSGPKVSNNENWLPYINLYVMTAYKTARDVRKWPDLLHPIVHWFLPSCHKLRKEYNKCNELITPALEQRRADKKARIARGLEPEEHNDVMEWLENSTNGQPYDATAAHLTFGMAGILSSTDIAVKVLYNLCGQPELIEDLRKEIIEVRSVNQWGKKTFSLLKLMDSVMKETQRLEPLTMVSMSRFAIRDTTLPDGIRISKGTRLVVSANRSWDNSIYPDAHKFDGYRFLRLREKGFKGAQFATTSSSTLGFRYGEWACPARGFASEELKIALSHILLKYDLKSAPGAKPKTIPLGFTTSADPTGRIMIRRRKEEIDL